MTSTTLHPATTKRHRPAPVYGTRDEHVAKMRAAADKHLSDRTPEERQAWAEAKVTEYLRRGILALEDAR